MMKISVIIPVYNAENYIENCIERLEKQTYKNFEIVAINDASRDNSLALLNKLCKKYKNLVIINLKKNGGAYFARQEGIKNATGDYIMFVDSDDYISDDAMEKLVKIINDKHVDIVKFRYQTYPKTIYSPEIFSEDQKIITEDEKKIIYNLLLSSKKLNNLSTIIAKKQLFDNSRLDERISLAEDYLQCCYAYTNAKRILFINDIFYFYYMNENSTTHSKNLNIIIENISDEITVYEYLKKIIGIWGLENKNDLILMRALNEIVDLLFIKLYSNDTYDELKSKAVIDYLINDKKCINFFQKIFSNSWKKIFYHNGNISIFSQILKYRYKKYLVLRNRKKLILYGKFINKIYKLKNRGI